jgi:hypothetical protein
MTTTRLQVRSWTRTGGHHCYYFAGVGPERAVQLSHAADAAVCCQHLDTTPCTPTRTRPTMIRRC